MGFFDTIGDIGKKAADVYSLGMTGFGAKDAQEEYTNQLNKSQQDYQNAITQGLGEGEAKAAKMYGADTLANLGNDISGVAAERKKLASGESPEIANMKRAAGKQEQVAQSKMAQSGLKGAYAQKATSEMAAKNAQNIATESYRINQANINAYQSLLGNISANSTATELGWGQLRAAGVSTPEKPEYRGILGNLGL